jgi:hypothetical protein
VGETASTRGLFADYYLPQQSLAAALGQADRSYGLFDRVVESRTKYVLIELEGVVVLKDDVASTYDLNFAEIAQDSPFRFIDLNGKRHKEPIPKFSIVTEDS